MFEQIDVKRASVIHPLVSDMYLKHENAFSKSRGDTLVIEANFGKSGNADTSGGGTFDSYLTELLLDLPKIKHEAEAHVGPFDKVCIRLC